MHRTLVALTILFVPAVPGFAAKFSSSSSSQDKENCAEQFLFPDFNHYFRLAPDLNQSVAQLNRKTLYAAQGLVDAIQFVKDLLRNNHFSFYNQLPKELADFDIQSLDFDRIESHIATAIIVTDDPMEIRNIAAMIFYMHVFDDFLDLSDNLTAFFTCTDSIYSLCYDIQRLLFKGSNSENSNQESPIVKDLHVVARKMLELVEAQHLEYRNILPYTHGLMQTAEMLVLASKMMDSVFDTKIDRSLIAGRSKNRIVRSLSPQIQFQFLEYPPQLFLLAAKSPMGAVFALEPQDYDEDRTFLWSLIFAPFFYDFKKNRHLQDQIPIEILQDALTNAFGAVKSLKDERLEGRKSQIRIMLKYWRHNIPEELQKIYRAFAN